MTIREALRDYVEGNPDGDVPAKGSNHNFSNSHLTNEKIKLSQFMSRAMQRIGLSDKKLRRKTAQSTWNEEDSKAAMVIKNNLKKKI